MCRYNQAPRPRLGAIPKGTPASEGRLRLLISVAASCLVPPPNPVFSPSAAGWATRAPPDRTSCLLGSALAWIPGNPVDDIIIVPRCLSLLHQPPAETRFGKRKPHTGPVERAVYPDFLLAGLSCVCGSQTLPSLCI